MYKVIKFFTDLHDGDHPYNAGDVFPRAGIEVTGTRIAELAGNDNKQGVPLIEEVVGQETGQEPQEENKSPVKRTRKTSAK